MNILPKKYSEFRDKEYWDRFFNKLKSTKDEYFQWYGAFADFRMQISLIVNSVYNLNAKLKDIAVFHVGCGKSTFAQTLLSSLPMYNLSIINCDYSQAIISDMIKRSNQLKLDQNKIKYEVCDLLSDIDQKHIGKYNIVIDKGTLDAILSQDSQQTIKQIKQKYFKNIIKSLSPKGVSSYILISMLQPYILSTILSHFFSAHYKITIYESVIADSQMQPFLLDIKYNPNGFKEEEYNVIELKLLSKEVIELKSIQQARERIHNLQSITDHSKKIKKLTPGQHSQFNIFNPGEKTKIRYMLDILDSADKQILEKNSCAIYIIPQGQENSPFYSTVIGLKSLHQQINTSRLIVVKLVIGNQFKGIPQIKQELNAVLPHIVQDGCQNKGIPYLTDGDQIGERNYLFEDQTLYIEEVLIRGEAFRRLILKSNIQIIQSQFKLGYVSGSKPQNQHLKEIPSSILPKKKNMLVGIDKMHLDDSYCRVIAAGIIAIQGTQKMNTNDTKILHLGGGACTLPTFFNQYYPTVQQTIIQISKSVINNCKKYFQWPQFNIIQQDAYNIIMKEEVNESTFDAIIIDIDTIENDRFPPMKYFSDEFINGVVGRLNIGGVVVYNVLTNDKSDRQTMINALNRNASLSLIYGSKSEESANAVLFAVKAEVIILEVGEEKEIVLGKDEISLKCNGGVDWQKQILEGIILIQPKPNQLFKNTNMKVAMKEEGEQKKKKKKKKK